MHPLTLCSLLMDTRSLKGVTPFSGVASVSGGLWLFSCLFGRQYLRELAFLFGPTNRALHHGDLF